MATKKTKCNEIFLRVFTEMISSTLAIPSKNNEADKKAVMDVKSCMQNTRSPDINRIAQPQACKISLLYSTSDLHLFF